MANAPTYRDEAGQIEGTTGVIIVNPDGSFSSGGGGGDASAANQVITNTKLDTLHADLATTLAGYLDGVEGKLDAIVSGAALTDASIASAAGSSETIAAASATRKVLNISNPAVTTWWINESGGTAAANGAGCFELVPGGRWTPRPAPTNIVKGIGTAASKLSVVVG